MCPEKPKMLVSRVAILGAFASSMLLGCNLSDPNPYVDIEDQRVTQTPPKPSPDMDAPDLSQPPPVADMDMALPPEDLGPMEEMGTVDSVCGDAQVTGSETCDGDCPLDPMTDCTGADACHIATIEGDAAQCMALCIYSEIEVCADEDGCCPLSCTPTEDSDCTEPRLAAGMPCSPSKDECGDDRVCLAPDGGEGLCSATCASEADCLEGEACLQIQGAGDARYCVTPCEAKADCPQNTACTPGEDLTAEQLFCIPPWLAASKIGQGCMDGGDCGDGGQCISPSNTFPGGYCTMPCNPEECPLGSVCHAVDPRSPEATSFCYAECATDGDCRAGYACQEKP
ncbi:MAG: hypothetical protein VX475_11865, partial [Myxococcota bacterium]|nr:hypothetical protein [Myxococcota bacterium]